MDQKNGMESFQSQHFTSHPILGVGEDVELFVCQCVPGRIFFMLVSELPEFSKLMEEMKSFYTEGVGGRIPGLTSISAGTPVAVMDPSGRFFRGEVVQTYPGNLMVTVFCVDVGNVENVSFRDIKPLDLSFLQPHRYAMECSREVELEGKVEKNEIMTGHVYGPDSEGNLIVERASGRRNRMDDHTGVSQDRSHDAEPPLQSVDQAFTVLPEDLLLEECLDVCLRCVESPVSFWVQVIDRRLGGSFQALSHAMNDHYGDLRESERISVFYPNVACAAQYPDGSWCRGCILAPPTSANQGVLVKFLDIGEDCFVHPNNIRVITAEFQKFPLLGVKCRLRDASPRMEATSWTPEAAQFMSQYMDTPVPCRFVSRCEDGAYAVEILVPDPMSPNPASLLTLLQKAALAAPLPSSDDSEYFPSRKEGGLDRIQIPQGLKLKKVTPVFIKSPDLFYVHVPGDADLLKTVRNALDRHYKNQPGIPVRRPARRGSACVVFDPEECCWMRAEVLDERAEEILVVKVDFGVEVWAGSADVCIMKDVDELWNTAALAIPCRLHGIRALTSQWPQSTLAKFKSLMDGGCRITFLRRNPEGVYKVEVNVRVGRSIADILLAQNLAVCDDPQRDVESNKFRTGRSYMLKGGCWTWTLPGFPDTILKGGNGDYLDVVSSHVSQDSIYFHLKEELGFIGEINAQLNNFYEMMEGEAEYRFPDPKPGNLCVAVYSVDERYYRAVVMGRVAKGVFTVYFVDYGNMEKVGSSGMRKLDPRFLAKPPLAFPCCLSGVPPTDSSQELTKILSSALVSNLTIQIDDGKEGGERLEVTLMFDDGVGTHWKANEILNGRERKVPVLSVPAAPSPPPVVTAQDMELPKKTKRHPKPRAWNNEYGSDHGSWSKDKQAWKKEEEKAERGARRKAEAALIQPQPHLLAIAEEEVAKADDDGEPDGGVADTLNHCLDICEAVDSVCSEVGQ